MLRELWEGQPSKKQGKTLLWWQEFKDLVMTSLFSDRTRYVYAFRRRFMRANPDDTIADFLEEITDVSEVVKWTPSMIYLRRALQIKSVLNELCIAYAMGSKSWYRIEQIAKKFGVDYDDLLYSLEWYCKHKNRRKTFGTFRDNKRLFTIRPRVYKSYLPHALPQPHKVVEVVEQLKKYAKSLLNKPSFSYLHKLYDGFDDLVSTILARGYFAGLQVDYLPAKEIISFAKKAMRRLLIDRAKYFTAGSRSKQSTNTRKEWINTVDKSLTCDKCLYSAKRRDNLICNLYNKSVDDIEICEGITGGGYWIETTDRPLRVDEILDDNEHKADHCSYMSDESANCEDFDLFESLQSLKISNRDLEFLTVAVTEMKQDEKFEKFFDNHPGDRLQAGIEYFGVDWNSLKGMLQGEVLNWKHACN